MLLKFIVLVNVLSYATCRTARQFREIPEAAARLTYAEYPWYNIIAPDGPGTYAFGYEIEDAATGNVQFRDEEKFRNGTVRGSYGVLLPDNTLHITRYIADQYGYRAKTETKKKSPNTPLKVELQLQPTVSSFPIKEQSQEYPFIQSTTTPFPNPYETIKPTIDPVVASQVYQQHHINLNPSQSLLRDPNILDPNMANAFLNQLYYVPQNTIYGLRQNPYDNSVSTYATSPNNNGLFPFFNWFGNNNNNNNNQYQDQAQPQRPVIDFFTNLASNNPVTNFFNSLGQQSQTEQNYNQNPFFTFISSLNPLNLINNNNNNNNNRPTASLPITQGDYIPQTASQQGSFVQPTNNIDNSVFSNDHFLNPNAINQNNPPVIHNYYPTSSSFNDYYRPQYSPYTGSWPNYNNLINSNNHNRPQAYNTQSTYPYTYYNPYQSMTSNNHHKKTKKRKKNKNKVNVDTDSDWFQDFLDKRKEASLEITKKHSSKKSDDDYDIDLDEYFR